MTSPSLSSATGCALSAAITAGLAQGQPLRDAVVSARSFVRDAISSAESAPTAAMAAALPGFANVPQDRWMAEAQLHYRQTDTGLEITYDPKLRDAVEAGGAVPDLWPFFDALSGKPTCLIRGAGSNLLSAATAAKMQARRPDMVYAEVPERGHVPFLDEPEAVAALITWMEQLT